MKPIPGAPVINTGKSPPTRGARIETSSIWPEFRAQLRLKPG